MRQVGLGRAPRHVQFCAKRLGPAVQGAPRGEQGDPLIYCAAPGQRLLAWFSAPPLLPAGTRLARLPPPPRASAEDTMPAPGALGCTRQLWQSPHSGGTPAHGGSPILPRHHVVLPSPNQPRSAASRSFPLTVGWSLAK